IIRDNPVRNTESDHNALEEFHRFGSCDRGDRFGFNPLGEFIDGDEEVCKTTQRSLQWADYVETPDCKWPSDQDSLQFLRRHMYLTSTSLASLAMEDVHLGIHTVAQYGHSDRGWARSTTPDGIYTDCLLRKTA